MRWDGWEGMTSSAARGRGRPAQFKLEFILGGMCLAALGGRSMRRGGACRWEFGPQLAPMSTLPTCLVYMDELGTTG